MKNKYYKKTIEFDAQGDAQKPLGKSSNGKKEKNGKNKKKSNGNQKKRKVTKSKKYRNLHLLMRQEVATLQRHVFELERVIAAKDATINELNAHINQQDQALAAIRASTTYRLGYHTTAPFRSIYRMFRSDKKAQDSTEILAPVQRDIAALSGSEIKKELRNFKKRFKNWCKHSALDANKGALDIARISVEVPVFKGSWLIPCIESVLNQSSSAWKLYLLWDGGDDLSRRILEIIKEEQHPRIAVFFEKNQGIAKARHFLSSKSREEYILPLDDDDLLASVAVERYLHAADARPWSSIIRGLRQFVDEHGNHVEQNEWFPFEARHYQNGMVTDIHNHCQPYLLSRRCYEATSGWEGFTDFMQAGEDCDIYLKMEEQGAIELWDEVLYYYRLNSRRTSHELTPDGAHEMWRRLADKTIDRIGLPLRRTNEVPPFTYEGLETPMPDQSMIDFVIPFFESDEEELAYEYSRPSANIQTKGFELDKEIVFEQEFEGQLNPCDRIEAMCELEKPVAGKLAVRFIDPEEGSVVADGEVVWSDEDVEHESKTIDTISIPINRRIEGSWDTLKMQIRFEPDEGSKSIFLAIQIDDGVPYAFMRVFRSSPGYSRSLLARCIESVQQCGISSDAIHLVSRKQSSAANRNEGYSLTSRPYVCFLDDDVEIIQEDTFEKLLQVMHETNAGIIGPKLITDIGTIFCSDPYFNDTMQPIPRGIGKKAAGKFDFTSEVTWLPSTLFIVKREVIKAIGGFDEGYVGSQMEDVDFCLKARLRDFKCVYDGHIDVVHYNHQRNDHFAANFQRFYERWKSYPELFIEKTRKKKKGRKSKK